MRTSSATTHRGPRRGSPNVRSAGIQKRRSGPVRVDKDGDMDMYAGSVKSGKGSSTISALSGPRAVSGPGRGRGRGRGRGAPATYRVQAIQRGISTQELKDKFKEMLSKRYDPALKLLDLSGLAQDPVLGELEGNTANTSKLFPALMAVCDSLFKTYHEKRDAIVSVVLSNNGLDTVQPVSSIASTLPDIKNLDLSGNLIANTKSLENWRWKFRKLENLVLSNNPIETQEPGYNDILLTWYPKLLLLNRIPVRSAEQVAALVAKAKASPIPIQVGNFRDVSSIGENFIKQFFTLYDSDRSTILASYYDSESVFSMAINMTSARDRDAAAVVPPWGAYIKHSRNLTKLKNPVTKMSRSHRGIQDIQDIWADFPATKHPDLATELSKYMIECRPQPGLPDPTGSSPLGVDGLFITIHGEFEEQNPAVTDRALRSFSRTFVLGPGAPGGLPIRVITDMLTLRAHSPLPAVPHSATVALPQTITLSDEQQKEMALKQLMDNTHMTMEYAKLCLEQTNWDLEKAYMAFEVSKVNLPAHAFIIQ